MKCLLPLQSPEFSAKKPSLTPCDTVRVATAIQNEEVSLDLKGTLGHPDLDLYIFQLDNDNPGPRPPCLYPLEGPTNHPFQQQVVNTGLNIHR